MKSTEQVAKARLAPEPSDLARLVAGEHHNPHGILGAHEYGDHTVIRAFRPHATSVVALVGADRFPLQHIDSGLFAAALPFVNLIDYRLEVVYDDGTPQTVADAYRFLPTLGEVDLHLFNEGRHERLWEVLGAHPRSFTTADGVVAVFVGAQDAVRIVVLAGYQAGQVTGLGRQTGSGDLFGGLHCGVTSGTAAGFVLRTV